MCIYFCLLWPMDYSPTCSSSWEIFLCKNPGVGCLFLRLIPAVDRTWVSRIAVKCFTMWATRQVIFMCMIQQKILSTTAIFLNIWWKPMFPNTTPRLLINKEKYSSDLYINIWTPNINPFKFLLDSNAETYF